MTTTTTTMGYRYRWCFALLLLCQSLQEALGTSPVHYCLYTAECVRKVAEESKCVDNVCTANPNPNPFQGGCLSSSNSLPSWNKLRVCNSDDSAMAAAEGLCQIQDIDYLEIRIFSQNWESAIFEAWILQIVLSELLDVPTTMETGTPDAHINFYNEQGKFEYGTSNDLLALENANAVGDCRLLNNKHNNDNDAEDGVTEDNADEEEYVSCAHVVLEVWDTQLAKTQAFIYDGVLEPPQSLGVLGQEAWYIPRFLAEKDPSLLSFLGLQGEDRRRKLAETFPRPLTWQTYCKDISKNNCTIADGVAARAPQDDWEDHRMFADDLYTGHFKFTPKNNCDLNPTNCTGHIADYPCGWSSYTTAQTHHLGIALDGDGDEPYSKGYSYSQLRELWLAANATKSNLIMMWWSPEALYQTFRGTDAEFVRVSLPSPSQECFDNRILPGDRCSEDFDTRVGSPLGVCDESVRPLQKLTLARLYDDIHDPSIPEAIRSPADEVLGLFSLSELQLDEIFALWSNSHSPREAVCQWAVDNLEYLESFVPRTYPRVQREEPNAGPLVYVSTTLGGVTVLLVLLTGAIVYLQRNRRVIRVAQIEFLWLLLAGALLISVGAILAGASPTDGSCVAEIWLVALGYTLELVPLIVKVAAINRIMHASRRMRRVKLTRGSLFGGVAVISLFVVMLLTLWTVMDPPRKMDEYEVSNSESDDGETIVNVRYYCGSDSDAWQLVALGWNMVLLLCASVMAFQTRNVPQEFRESRTLAMMIYSHTMFVVLRAVTFMLSSPTTSEWTMAHLRSLIFSLDTCATLVIYFAPKLTSRDEDSPNSSDFMSSTPHFVRQQQAVNRGQRLAFRPRLQQWISSLPSMLSHSHADDETDDAIIQIASDTSGTCDGKEQSKKDASIGHGRGEANVKHVITDDNASSISTRFDEESVCDMRFLLHEHETTIAGLRQEVATLAEKLAKPSDEDLPLDKSDEAVKE